jgi:hypothetical protein
MDTILKEGSECRISRSNETILTKTWYMTLIQLWISFKNINVSNKQLKNSARYGISSIFALSMGESLVPWIRWFYEWNLTFFCSQMIKNFFFYKSISPLVSLYRNFIEMYTDLFDENAKLQDQKLVKFINSSRFT